MGLSGSNIVDLIARKLLKPLNHSYLPNLEKNIWPELADPFYDRGARYTVPYVVWMDGIGWRNDKVKEDVADMDVPWDIFWQAQAYRGQVGILDDRRDALSMPMQRDAMRRDVRPDLNTEDEAVVDKAQRDLSQLSAICNPKVTITDYQTLPEGKTVLHHSWSGDLLGGGLLLHAQGRAAVGALVLGARPERRGAERLLLRRQDGEEPGARARVHQLLPRREERVRQLRQLHRLHPAAEEHRRGRRC